MQAQVRRFYATEAGKQLKKVAVVLSGCGVLDGSEIHEAVSTLIHLSANGFQYECFAPNIQVSAKDHITGSESGEKRSVLVESARIARGQIKGLDTLNVADFDAVVFPGGYGAATNLCSFAVEGTNCKVDASVERVIKDFHKHQKPLGFMCIAPVLAAKVLGTSNGGPGVSVTVGHSAQVGAAINELGATHVEKDGTQVHVDTVNRVFTTPAYMEDQPIDQVYAGIGNLVSQLKSFMSQ